MTIASDPSVDIDEQAGHPGVVLEPTMRPLVLFVACFAFTGCQSDQPCTADIDCPEGAICTCTYDEDGNLLTKKVDENTDGRGNRIYTYDPHGNMIAKAVDEDGNGAMDWRVEYTYGEDGLRLNKEENWNGSGSPELRSTFADYDESGNLLMEYRDHDVDETVDEQWSYSYDEMGNRLAYETVSNRHTMMDVVCIYTPPCPRELWLEDDCQQPICWTPSSLQLIAAGTFTMGSPEDESGRESDESSHQVTLTRNFYLQAHEVTQGEWRALMGTNPSYFAACGHASPVEQVTWWDALAYANALSDNEGLPRCYTLEGCDDAEPGNAMQCDSVTVNAADDNPYECRGYRLPTEAEWEYAARGGTSTPWACGPTSECVELVGWYWNNAGEQTHPATGKAPNAWGLFDMSGNVWEWVWDSYGDYPTAEVTDPTGPQTGEYRVFRGGDCVGDAQIVRLANRRRVGPGDRPFRLGFRLVLTAF